MWSTSAGGHFMKVVNLTGFTVIRYCYWSRDSQLHFPALCSPVHFLGVLSVRYYFVVMELFSRLGEEFHIGLCKMRNSESLVYWRFMQDLSWMWMWRAWVVPCARFRWHVREERRYQFKWWFEGSAVVRHRLWGNVYNEIFAWIGVVAGTCSESFRIEQLLVWDCYSFAEWLYVAHC
jgi:hypothetical protein